MLHYLLILTMLNAPGMSTDRIIVNLPPDRSCIQAQHDAAEVYEKLVKGSRVLDVKCIPVEPVGGLVIRPTSR